MIRRCGVAVLLAACLVLAQAGCADKSIVTLPDGLKYKDLHIGEGRAAQVGDTVEVFYTGWLTDGKQFDSNIGGAPLVVPLGQKKVIPGWEEGLLGMRAGGKRRLLVPPGLGYGARGSGKDIPPNATLIFEIEVSKVRPGSAP